MNLEKLKDTARKYEQKEDWRKAIDVYLKAIQQFETGREGAPDLSLYNRVGDLYLKTNDSAAAVRSYERAVDLYADQGFFNNAIALCGKILRVNPGRTPTYLKLAQLHARKNVVFEAKRNLLEYVERMSAEGHQQEAFKAVREFVNQFSPNRELRAMLGELLREAAKIPGATAEAEKLSAELEGRSAPEAARPPAEASGADSAGEDRPASAAGRGGDLIFLDTGIEPSSLADRSRAAPAPVDFTPTSAAPDGLGRDEPPPPLDGLEIAAETPLLADAIEPMAVEGIDRIDLDTAPVGGTIEMEPTAFGSEHRGDPADDLVPDSDLGLIEDRIELERIDDTPLAFGGERLEGLDEPAADVFADSGASATVDLDDGAIEFAGGANEGEAGRQGLDFLEVDAPAVADGTDEPTEPPDQRLPYIEPAAAPSSDSIQALEERILENPADPLLHRELGRALAGIGETGRAIDELELALGVYESRADWHDAIAAVDQLIALDSEAIARYQKKVELAYRTGQREPLVEAYLALAGVLERRGAVDKAAAVFDRVLEHDPENTLALAALHGLRGGVGAAVEDSASESPGVEETPADAIPQAERREPAAGNALAESMSRAAAEDGSAEGPPATGAGFVDLGSLVLEDEVQRDTRMRVDAREPTSDDEERTFREILAEFKRGIEQSLGSEDYQAHYDLGIAFKEMGLLDEAIAAFQKALRAPEGRLRTSEALGVSFYEKGQFAISEAILRRAVDSLDGTDDAKIGLIYWLGRASEALGRADDAIASYQRALAVDIRFMDTNERVQRLAAERR